MNRKLILRILLTIIFLALIVKTAGPAKIKEAAQAGDYVVILLAILFTPICIGLKALRWHLFARRVFPGLKFSRSLRSYLAGLGVSIITPAASGELARGFFLDRKKGLELTGLVIVDKFVDLSMLLLLAFFGMGFVRRGLLRPLFFVMGVGFLFLPLAVKAGWQILPALFERISSFVSTTSRQPFLLRLSSAVARTPRGLIMRALVLAFFNYLVYYMQAFVVVRGFAQELSVEAVAVFPLVTLSTLIPTIGGLGIREFTAGWLLSHFGVTKAVAANGFFLHFVIVTVLPALVWLGFWGGARERKSLAQTEEEGEKARGQ
ncbi:MAG: hypothetical protein AMS15_00335 [Planctomycetes bacterium DG_23]|nr:MAG: hypothetical protein AMS15_00335 [Planctomycetes bacterium DG_23]